MPSAAEGLPGSELQINLELLHRLYLAVRADSRGCSEPVASLLAQLQARPSLDATPALVLRVYSELAQTLKGLRQTRSAVQSQSMERLRDTHARLGEVSSTTETAAMEMLNGLDRSLAMIDRLERPEDPAAHNAELYDALRAEVNQLYGHLQFQDIITQQLHGVTALLLDVEQRISTIAGLIDDAGEGAAGPVRTAPDEASYNAHASMRDAEGRQALIDEAFLAARDGAAA